MAALMGSVETRTAEYRPCYVITSKEYSGGEVVKRTERKALFHRWVEHRKPYGADGKLVGFEASTYALIEYEDGTVSRVRPEYVRFVPGIMNE